MFIVFIVVISQLAGGSNAVLNWERRFSFSGSDPQVNYCIQYRKNPPVCSTAKEAALWQIYLALCFILLSSFLVCCLRKCERQELRPSYSFIDLSYFHHFCGSSTVVMNRIYTLSVKWTSFYVVYSGGCKCNSKQ
jgi:hypothetical protein